MARAVVRLHDLRHSHISLLIDMGFTALAIADRVGHESIDITYRYGRVRESNARLSDRLQEVKLENKALRQVSADYERVKRAFGVQEVETAVKRQEQTDKARKQSKKSFGQSI